MRGNTCLTVFLCWLCISVAAAQAPDHLSSVRQAIQQGDLERAGALLDGALGRRPEDTEARFLRARVRSWQEQWDESLADYESLLQRDPRNVDYLLGKGQVLLWSGRPGAAADVAAEARGIAPDREASYRLELDALLASDAPGADEEAKALAALAQSHFPSARFELPPPASRFEVSVGTTQESLSAGFADWSSYYVDGTFRLDADRSISAALRSSERFGIEDRELSIGTALRINERWSGTGSLTVGPDARVLPRSAIALSVHRKLALGWGVELGVRHSDYESTYSDVLFAGIERYWNLFRFSYRLYRGEAEAADATLSHVLRGDLYYGERSSIGLLVGGGEESENIGVAQLITTDVTSVSLLGQHQLTPAWTILWSVGLHEQGDLYDRRGVDIAIRYRY